MIVNVKMKCRFPNLEEDQEIEVPAKVVSKGKTFYRAEWKVPKKILKYCNEASIEDGKYIVNTLKSREITFGVLENDK